jgi:hypothetical protein
MKTVRAKSGPFQQRPHFSTREIEEMCSGALRGVDLFPTEPEPVRIERFVEKHFRVVPQYDDLPKGVLGFTQFGPAGVGAIVVSKTFEHADAPRYVERRLRTTLAHEAGHGLMHAYLFALGEKPLGLFDDDDSTTPSIMCRDVHGAGAPGRGYDGRWWEYQANRAIGALLLPRPLARAAATPFLRERGLLGEAVLPADSREEAAQALADVFDVNPAVARIRVNEIFDPKTDTQLSL